MIATIRMSLRIIAEHFSRDRIHLTGETPGECRMHTGQQQLLYNGSNRSGAAAERFR